jgi:hypothetical protein
VDNGGLDDDSTIFNQFSNICARVGISNFVLLGWIQPNLALAYAGDGRGETLLGAQVDHSFILENQESSAGGSKRSRAIYLELLVEGGL